MPPTNTHRSVSYYRCCLLHVVLGTLSIICLLRSAPADLLAQTAIAEQVVVQDGTITVQLENASLPQVIAEIGRQLGAQIRWLSPPEQKLVSATFTAVPLAEALDKLLGERGFLLFYPSIEQSETPSQIWIAPVSRSRALVLTSQDHQKVTSEQKDTTIDSLIQTALYDPNSSARLEAVLALDNYSAADPRVISTLSLIAKNETNLQIRTAASEILNAFQ